LTKTIGNTEVILTKAHFENLFFEAYADLCAYAKLFVNDLDEAEEIVQDIFVKFWENRSEIEILASSRAYLFKAVRNSCLNFIKHRKIEDSYKQQNQAIRDEGIFAVDEELAGSELEQKIRIAIDKLPPERKKIFIMCRFEGLRYKEIADKTGISVKTVENQMGKAMKFLKEELSDYIPLIAFLALANFFEN
jgi:RNA polymerase sigma-70 factor (ECF subfamily)